MRFPTVPGTIVLLLAVLGCSQWKTSQPTSAPQLPLPKLASDSIGIEIATVTLLPDQKTRLPRIFSQLDEQVLAPDMRRLLALNGLRVGVFGAQLPEPIHLLLMEAGERARHPTAESQWIADEQRYVQCRPGKKVDIPIWPIARAVEIEYDDGQFFIPETLELARPFIQFTHIFNESSTALRLQPLVHHGPLRQKYVVEENTFHFEAKQDLRAYKDLAMEVALSPGEVLLISCDPDSDEKTLGQQFFSHPTTKAQKLVLIRVAQTQIEDIFQPGP